MLRPIYDWYKGPLNRKKPRIGLPDTTTGLGAEILSALSADDAW